MKKSILNLGKALNKAEQKEINGGRIAIAFCDASLGCPSGSYCENHLCYRDNDNGGGGSNGGGCTTPTHFCIDENDTCCIW